MTSLPLLVVVLFFRLAGEPASDQTVTEIIPEEPPGVNSGPKYFFPVLAGYSPAIRLAYKVMRTPDASGVVRVRQLFPEKAHLGSCLYFYTFTKVLHFQLYKYTDMTPIRDYSPAGRTPVSDWNPRLQNRTPGWWGRPGQAYWVSPRPADSHLMLGPFRGAERPTL